MIAKRCDKNFEIEPAVTQDLLMMGDRDFRSVGQLPRGAHGARRCRARQFPQTAKKAGWVAPREHDAFGGLDPGRVQRDQWQVSRGFALGHHGILALGLRHFCHAQLLSGKRTLGAVGGARCADQCTEFHQGLIEGAGCSGGGQCRHQFTRALPTHLGCAG